MGRVTETGARAPQDSARGTARTRAQADEERQLSLLAQRLAPIDADAAKLRRAGPRRSKPMRATKRRTPAGPRGRLVRRAAAAACLALGVVASVWAWQSEWAGRAASVGRDWFYAATAEAGLAVREVLAEGRERTAKAAILEALGAERGSPILAISPAAAKARLEGLPWIREATVERRFPDTFYIRIEERHPIALWQRDGTLTVIDQVGEPIQAASLSEFAHLPIVVGEDAPRHALDLLTMLRIEPDLSSRVTAAVRVGGRRWSVRLDDVIDIHLPMDDPAGAWAKLAIMNRRHAVLGRDVTAIDLRLPDRMVVRMAPGAAIVEEPGKDT